MTVRYKPDYAGMHDLMNGPEMQAMLRGVAEQGMADAIVRAPVRTGDYKAHFSVTVQADGGIHKDRAEALIVNNSGHAVLVEWHDEFHTLRDAAAELGGAL